jgi:Sigma-70, region 4
LGGCDARTRQGISSKPGNYCFRARGAEQTQSLLSVTLKTLEERERHILIERCLQDKPTTLEAPSEQYGISPERVRQIEVWGAREAAEEDGWPCDDSSQLLHWRLVW